MEVRGRGLQPWRRLLHALSGILLAWLPAAAGLSRPAVVGLLGGFLLLLLAADVVRLRAPRVNALFFSLFPSMASPREEERLASSTWYVLGALIVYALFPSHVAAPAILVLALADPAASVLGRLLPSRALGKGTIGGSVVFLLVTMAVLGPAVGWVAALVVALGVTLVEVLPWPLDDNLTVPVAAAAFLWIVGA